MSAKRKPRWRVAVSNCRPITVRANNYHEAMAAAKRHRDWPHMRAFMEAGYLFYAEPI